MLSSAIRGIVFALLLSWGLGFDRRCFSHAVFRSYPGHKKTSNSRILSSRISAKESIHDILTLSDNIFSLASSSTVSHASYIEWELKMERMKSTLTEVDDPQQLQELYGKILYTFPFRKLDLLLLATFDGVLEKVVEQWFMADVVRAGISLREFIDSLNEVHLSVLHHADYLVSRSVGAVDCELLCYVFDRIFKVIDSLLDRRYDHSAEARRHRISHWIAPIEARLQRINSRYDIGSYRSSSAATTTAAIDRLLHRIDFSVAGLNLSDSYAFAPAHLAHFVSSLLRNSVGLSDGPELHQQISDRTIFEMRRVLSLRLAPLLQPLCEIEASFGRRIHCVPGQSLLATVLSEDQQAVATNVSILAQDCVAALLLDWQLQEDRRHIDSRKDSFSGSIHESLDDIELRHEGSRLAKAPATVATLGVRTPADRIAAIPLLIQKRKAFHGGVYNSSQLLIGPQGLALLSLPGHLRESVAFASRDVLKRLCRHYQGRHSGGLREGVNAFESLESILTQLAGEESSVALDMAILGVSSLYGSDGNSWIRSSNASEEEQVAAAVLLGEGLRSAAVEKIRALNLYNNFREDLVNLNRDSQYAAHLLIALVRFFDFDNSDAKTEDERFADLLHMLVAQTVLDSVFAAPSPERSARMALYRAARLALHSIATTSSLPRMEIFASRLKRAESAVFFMLLRDEPLDFDVFHDELLRDLTKWKLEDAIALLPRQSDAIDTAMAEWRRISREVLSRCLGISSASTEAKILRQLGEAFDERATNLLLDRSIVSGGVVDISEELERQLLQLFPTIDGDPPSNRLDKLHQRLRLLAAQVSASLLSMILVERSAGNANRAETLEHRWLQLVQHPLLTRSYRREIDKDAAVLNDTLDALWSRWRSQNEPMRRKLTELLSAVEVARRSQSTQGGGGGGGTGRSLDRKTLLLEKLHQRLLQEYARLALQQD